MARRRPPRPEDALARAVLDRYLAVRRGESVLIESWSHALPWARSFVVEARRRGARPSLTVEDEEAFFRSLGSSGSSAGVFGAEPALRGGAHVYFGGPEQFPRLLGLLPRDLERLRGRHDTAWWRAARRAGLRAVRIAVSDATETAAKRYGVGQKEWERELTRGSLVDPRSLELSGRRWLRRLARSRRLRVTHPNGTDLVVERGGRAPTIDSGRPDPSVGSVWGRVPAGLLILPLDSRATEGTWETNRPAYDRFAEPPVALGGRFDFRAGRLTEFAFDRGGEQFAAATTRAGPHRTRAIALTVGLNPAISQAPEVQELADGTVGLLLGDSAYRPAGTQPRFSFLAPLAGAAITLEPRPARHRPPGPRR